MSFFNYPIYDIPTSSEVIQVTLSKPISIFVNEDQYDDSAATLLSKVLGSVGQVLDACDIHKIHSEANIKIQGANDKHLILIFGYSPKTFSLQIDRTLYQLTPLENQTLLFSKPLTELPELPQDKRALWIALKAHFNIS